MDIIALIEGGTASAAYLALAGLVAAPEQRPWPLLPTLRS